LDLVREQPVVGEALNNFLECGLMPPLFGFARGNQPVHFGVYCDGCSENPELKAAAVLAQTISDRGFIAGTRYKSVTANDFDLCETCHSTDKFEAQSPFVKFAVPQHHFGGGRGAFFRANCSDSDRHWRSRGPCFPHFSPHGPPSAPHGPQHGPHHGPPQGFPHGPAHCPPFGRRGCRGSGAGKFSEALRDVIAQGATAFADASDGEMADIARAIALSLGGNSAKSASSEPAAKLAVPEAQVRESKGDESAASAVQTPQQIQVPVAQPINEPTVAFVNTEPQIPDDWEQENSDFVKWAKELDQLQAIGFVESEKYIQFLEEEHGDLERVINRIVRRNS